MEYHMLFQHIQKEIETLHSTSQIFQALEEIPFVGMVLYTDKILYANKSALEHLGYSLDELRQKNIMELIVQEKENIGHIVQKRLQGEQFVRHHEPILLRKKNGETIYTYFFSKTLFIDDCPIGLSVVIDMTEDIKMEEKLRQLYLQNEELLQIFESINGAIIKMDEDFNILHASGYWQKYFSFQSSNFLSYLLPRNQRLLRQSLPVSFKDRLGSKDRWYEIEILKLSNGYGAIVKDITHHEKEKERLKKLAHYDPLTKLPNRKKCIEYIESFLAFYKVHQSKPTALLFLDINDFKKINDTYGHNVGDRVLQVFSKRIASKLKRKDKFCRFAGDEFVVLLPFIRKQYVPTIIHKIHSALKEPIYFGSFLIFLSTSIGVAFIPENGKNAQELLECADKAMYRAKQWKLPFALCSDQEAKPLSQDLV